MDDPNRRNHIFGEPKHNLDELVRQCGGEEEAGQAIDLAANASFGGGNLITDGRGYFKQAFDIGGNPCDSQRTCVERCCADWNSVDTTLKGRR